MTRIDVVEGRPVVNSVFVNGQGPYRFLLDSGAQTNQIEAGLGLKLGLVPVSRVELIAAGGKVIVPRCVAKSARVGETESGNQEFLLTDLKSIRLLDRKIDGVLGQSFLEHFDYSIDFHTKRLEFGAAGMEGVRVPTELREGSMSIETGLGRMILDSGTDTLVLFREGSGREARIATAAGFVATQAVEAQSIQIAGRKFRSHSTAYLPVEEGRDSGLLPMSLFRAVFVCNSKGYIVIPGK